MAAPKFPSRLTDFVGRQTELAEILALLKDPDCRLLTIIGPGGIGKTRLAREIMQRAAPRFANGAHIVYLNAVSADKHLAAAVLDALAVPLSGQDTPHAQLLRFLRDQQMLLVLDNFEHLVSVGDLIADMLAAAPEVRLLVTSRGALSLRAEWLYPLEGLPCPTDTNAPADIATYDAARLFALYARRVRRDFSLEQEAEAVLRICRAVDGMPLALELAASWARTLSCSDIAREIEHNLSFLETDMRDFPARHGSMQAVFDQSWARLNDQEREVFRRLAVFRGGFRRDAAEAVAGATLPVLSALVDQSLLRRLPEDRYSLHPLLRQYAEEQLAQDADALAQTRAAHHRCYAAFLQQHEANLRGGDQQQAIRAVAAELDNIRAAWENMTEQADLHAITQAAYALNFFLDYQGRYAEAIDSFGRATHSLETPAPTYEQAHALALVLVMLGWFYIRVARVDEARNVLLRAQALYEQHHLPYHAGGGTDPQIGLAILAMIAGDFERAFQLGQTALQGHTARMDYHNQAGAHYVLAIALLAQGQYTPAYEHAWQASTVAKASGDRWFRAYCLNEMGSASLALGNFDLARSYFQESYEIRRSFDDPEGQAVALNLLGRVALAEHAYEDAARQFHDSLTLYRRIGDHGGLASTLAGLADAFAGQHRHPEATRHYAEALQIAAQHDLITLVLLVLGRVGHLLIARDQRSTGLQLISFVLAHPGSPQDVREQARSLLQAHQSQVAEAAHPAESSPGAALEPVVFLAQNTLRALISADESARSASPSQPGLLPADALSERELEVLALLADGLSNSEIAERLVLALGTVKAHNHQIYSKLGVRGRTQAILRARELGLV